MDFTFKKVVMKYALDFFYHIPFITKDSDFALVKVYLKE